MKELVFGKESRMQELIENECESDTESEDGEKVKELMRIQKAREEREFIRSLPFKVKPPRGASDKKPAEERKKLKSSTTVKILERPDFDTPVNVGGMRRINTVIRDELFHDEPLD